MRAARVLPAVASSYAEDRGLSIETATAELLGLIDGAKESEAEPGRYRYRNRADRLDVTARVVNDCVIAVTVRGYSPPRGGGR